MADLQISCQMFWLAALRDTPATSGEPWSNGGRWQGGRFITWYIPKSPMKAPQIHPKHKLYATSQVSLLRNVWLTSEELDWILASWHSDKFADAKDVSDKFWDQTRIPTVGNPAAVVRWIKTSSILTTNHLAEGQFLPHDVQISNISKLCCY